MRKLCVASIVFMLATCTIVYADRGSIPYNPDARIFEPTQRAMIAWNGDEEILLLSTDMRASEQTKVLEILPLPSKPDVKKGDIEAFRRATALINKRLQEYEGRGRGAGGGPPAGEITFYKKIGAHEIAVAHVLNGNGFLEWVEKYLRSAASGNPTVPEALKSVVGEYIEDGFEWFVFDVVSLDEKPKTQEAIQYRFATESLYYPLRITRTEEGETSIELLILTPMPLNEFSGIPVEQVDMPHTPITITSDELRSLDEDMASLLGHRDDVKLGIWRIRGKLSSFNKDLLVGGK